jgi:hypothetical protein
MSITPNRFVAKISFASFGSSSTAGRLVTVHWVVSISGNREANNEPCLPTFTSIVDDVVEASALQQALNLPVAGCHTCGIVNNQAYTVNAQVFQVTYFVGCSSSREDL